MPEVAVAEPLYRALMTSPVGPLTLVVSERGVRAIHFGEVAGPAPGMDSDTKTQDLERQLREYFAGQRRQFDLPLDWRGTPYQSKVWSELLKIPYGSTASYLDIAHSVGNRSPRSVGQANRRNPIPIVVPCHRVVAADGTMGGYSGGAPGGLRIKDFLLRLER
ncbi:MAG TPA: methylated-DNA--[protein]-cysteine S-methyltransferase [Terriglobales bacterium]|nr:methylated-DNA--[protein]-cysteine S-methyltransferase [Terriglobales bacterium]